MRNLKYNIHRTQKLVDLFFFEKEAVGVNLVNVLNRGPKTIDEFFLRLFLETYLPTSIFDN